MSVIIAINRVSTRYYETLDDCNKSFEYFLVLRSDIYVKRVQNESKIRFSKF